MTIPMIINTNSLTTYTYKTKIEIGTYRTGDFVSSGELPVEGELKVTIYKEKPRFSLSVKVNESWRAFTMPSSYSDSGTKWNFVATYDFNRSVETLGKKLVKATYDITDELGKVIRSSVFTGSQLDYSHESPLALNKYIQGDDVEVFSVPKDRVTYSSNEYVEVTFEYQ